MMPAHTRRSPFCCVSQLEDRINPDYTLSLAGTTLTITSDSGDKSLVGSAYFAASDTYSILDSDTSNAFHDNGTGVITGGDGTNQVFLNGSKFDRIVWVLGDQNDQFSLFGSKDKTDVDLGDGKDTFTVAQDGATTSGGKVDGGGDTDTISYLPTKQAANISLGDIGVWHADLTGSEEVPPTDSKATGFIDFLISSTPSGAISIGSGTVRGIAQPSLIDFNIVKALPGANGPVSIPLGGGENWSRGADGQLHFDSSELSLTDAQVADLIAGYLSANVHTTQYPDGEIRGQLMIFAPPNSATGIGGGISGFENALGGDGDDVIVGNGGANTLQGGNNGNDVLFGLDGNDQLFGVAGSNRLRGGPGDDKVTGGTGDDEIIWKDGDGTDTVDGKTGTNTLRLVGSNGNDFIDIRPQTGSLLADSIKVGLGVISHTTYVNIQSLSVNGLGGDDTVQCAPSETVPFFIDGGTGSNTLQVNPDGTETNLVVPPYETMTGVVTADNRMPINFHRCGPTPHLSVGNLVWLDANNNGKYEPASEAGVAKVPVRLFRDGVQVRSTTTDAKGLYLFTGLEPGDYVVEITPPAGTTSSRGVAGEYEPAPDPDNDIDHDDNGTRAGLVIRALPVTLAFGKEPTFEDGNSNSNLTVDFGLVPVRNMRVFNLIAVGSGSGGSGAVRLVDQKGATLQSADVFPGFTGGVRVVMGDVNGDGVGDVIAGTGPGGATRVQVRDGADLNRVLFSIDGFEASFTGGLFVATGDVNGDGLADIIFTPDEGGGPRCKVISGSDFKQIADFFGIDDPNFRGGARPTVGDLNGDGIDDLLVAAGFGGGPRVAGFEGSSLATTPTRLFADFFAFESTLRNGVFLASADVNGDGIDDGIFGGGPGGGPRVLILDSVEVLAGRTDQEILSPLGNFFAGDTNNRGGVRLGVKDFDGDGKDDIVTGGGPGTAGGHVRAYSGATFAEINSFFAFASDFTNGVFVG